MMRDAEERARDIERLAPVARELAARAGELGVIFADVRIVAVQRGILTGEERGRMLSYAPAVMRAAGLEPSGEYRRSHIPKSHGNLHAVWRRVPIEDSGIQTRLDFLFPRDNDARNGGR